MKDTQGWMLRETWKANGKPDCLHPELSQERSFAGMITGAYICTTCGYLFEVRESLKDKPNATLLPPREGGPYEAPL